VHAHTPIRSEHRANVITVTKPGGVAVIMETRPDFHVIKATRPDILVLKATK
jgi:hypothetical protein